ncbi:hypothetical protein DOLIC_00122 [Dolichomitus sp. PSUC_FEM 10030005]|nr:hypothetical protein [Dolichomitus sp. PSUC_FEM 10030005]
MAPPTTTTATLSPLSENANKSAVYGGASRITGTAVCLTKFQGGTRVSWCESKGQSVTRETLSKYDDQIVYRKNNEPRVVYRRT